MGVGSGIQLHQVFPNLDSLLAIRGGQVAHPAVIAHPVGNDDVGVSHRLGRIGRRLIVMGVRVAVSDQGGSLTILADDILRDVGVNVGRSYNLDLALGSLFILGAAG